MNRFKNHLIAGAVLSVLAVIGTIMNSHQAAAQGPPNGLAVNIVNPVPVPVTGSLGITGTPKVTIDSTQLPLSVMDADSPSRHAFQLKLDESQFSFKVPPDKRLTIETVSASCHTDPPSTPQNNFPTYIATTAGGNFITFPILTFFNSTSPSLGTDYWGNATAVRIYADPGTEIDAFTGRNGSHCAVDISGYMIPR
jgi:hypothetical protein